MSASIASLVSAVLVVIAGACQSSGTTTPSTGTAPSATELWTQNCARCHNIRSPADFSDAEWDVAAFHMRVRADLTAEEHRQIRDFLKASN